MTKLIKEYHDGFRWVDGDTSSAPFEKDSELWCQLIDEGCDVEYLSNEEKDDRRSRLEREQFKQERTQAVQRLTVTTSSGNTFDADETSQTRMSRAITIMDDAETTVWVLADNTPIQATKAELKEALRLAGEAQSALWVMS